MDVSEWRQGEDEDDMQAVLGLVWTVVPLTEKKFWRGFSRLGRLSIISFSFCGFCFQMIKQASITDDNQYKADTFANVLSLYVTGSDHSCH